MNKKHFCETMVCSIVACVTFLILASSTTAFAHCDTLDGPVIMAAKKALDTGNVNLVLIWVQKKDELAIGKAFQKTLAVRKLNPDAKELADMYFFETLVRIHRTGEGAPYTGIEPAGLDLGPAISGADKSLETGSVDNLLKTVTKSVEFGIREHFERAMKLKKDANKSVDAGREYVEAYVTYIHYVERIYNDATAKAAHHGTDKEAAEHNE
jgi:hypothetical protein